MKIYKLEVTDTNSLENNGYTVYIENEYALGIHVETAAKNGYEYIKISIADQKEIAEMNILKGANLTIMED